MGDVARAGRTVILVTHQLNQIRRLCHRVVWLDDGVIRRTGATTEVVGAYEAAMSSQDRISADRLLDQKHGARFVSWSVLDGSPDSPHSISTSGPVRVRFLFETHSPVRRGHHGIALYNPERQIVWGWAADDLDLEPGLVELVHEFPYLPLRPGTYSWMLSLWSDGQNIDLWDAVPDFLINTENLQHSRDEWSGYLKVPSSFSWRKNDSGVFSRVPCGAPSQDIL
jgi:hypothetical protein